MEFRKMANAFQSIILNCPNVAGLSWAMNIHISSPSIREGSDPLFWNCESPYRWVEKQDLPYLA